MSGTCDISLVCATKNRAELLDAMLASVPEAAGNVRYEIVIVEGGSIDGTPDVMKKHGVTAIYREADHFPAGRQPWAKLYNFGFSKASGKYVMYASDDIVFAPHCLSRAFAQLEAAGDNVAAGAFFYKNNVTDQKEWQEYGIDYLSGGKILLNYGLLRKQCFDAVGGLDEDYRFYCADADLSLKFSEAQYAILPMEGCFVFHDNVMDARKTHDVAASRADLERYETRWKHFIDTSVLPNPRRLLKEEQMAPVDFPEAWKQMQDRYIRLKAALRESGVAERERAYIHEEWAKYCEQFDALIRGLPREDFLRHPAVQGTMVRVGVGAGQNYEQMFLNTCVNADVRERVLRVQDVTIGGTTFECSDPLCSANTLGHLYYAARICESGWRDGMKCMVEFGGGYGNLVRILAKAGMIESAVIIDVPETMALQSLFLSLALPEFRVVICTEAPKAIVPRTVYLVPVYFLADLDIRADIFVSTFALSESAQKAQNGIVQKGFFGAEIVYIAGQLSGGSDNKYWVHHGGILGAVRRQYEKADCRPFHVFWGQDKVDAYEVCGTVHRHAQIGPSVSIFMPVYNGAKYISATIESIIEQTYKDWELVIVDDGSTDGTLRIAQGYAARDTRIRIVSHEKNRGLSAARNTGLADVHASSLYVMNHDSDDISMPTKLARLVDHLERNPGIAAVGSIAQYFNDAGEITGAPAIKHLPADIRRTMGEVNSMLVSATLIRREMAEKIAPFRGEFGGCDDYDFWTRALLAGFELENIPEPLHLIRLHAASMGSTQGSAMEEKAREIRANYRGGKGGVCAVGVSEKSSAPQTQAVQTDSAKMPRLSVCMPVYNGAKNLATSIESIVEQSFNDWELIIVDDGSTDATKKIAERCAAKDARIKVIASEHQGSVAARNLAFLRTDPRSEFLLMHSGDDVSLPNKFAGLVGVLQGHPSIALVGSQAAYFNDAGEDKGQSSNENTTGLIRARFAAQNQMIESATIIRRCVFEKIGMYREEYRGAEDYDLFARALLAGYEMANVPQVLHAVRVQAEGAGGARLKRQKDLSSRIASYYAKFTEQGFCATNPLLSTEKRLPAAEPVAGKNLRLHVGCGDVKVARFINVDIDPALKAVDVVDDVRTLSRFSPDSVSVLYACHVLEHLPHGDIFSVIMRWYDVLQPGGEIRISVPDIDRIVKIYQKHWAHFQTRPNTPWVGLIYGGQLDEYDYHKTGFNFCYLAYILETAGFVDIEEYPHEPHWLGIRDGSSANWDGEHLSLNIKAKKPQRT